MQSDPSKKLSITFPDFVKLDIRVGEVKDAKPVEKSKKLIELTVDLGPEYGIVTIFTGMITFYEPAHFLGKKFLFLANLEPKKMLDSFSQGMLLSGDEQGKPVLVEVDKNLPNGLLIR